jgi:outer membrane murein-binding lipoprotein Lpp
MRPRPARHRFSPLGLSFLARIAPLVGATVLLASTSCANPRAEAAIAQELNDAATEISAVKGDIAQLQSDVDSLRQVIAKQDTVISRLVEVTHVPR